jgi:hypothetical protein
MDIQEVTEGNDVWFVARLLRPDNVILSRDAIAGSGGSNTDAFQVRVGRSTPKMSRMTR